MNPVPVPTLDALAADPGQAVALPGPAVAGLLARLAAVQAALAARALTLALEPAEPPSADADRLLTAEEAAERLAMSRDWVYRHARRLPFTVRLDGSALRFTAHGIDRYLRQRRAAIA